MPERFGRYWLHEKIGHGGMAEIFRATIGPDPGTYAFDIALKRMYAHLEKDPAQVDMFLTEADIAKFLHHPNLVRTYEAGMFGGRAYIAMESIWGHDLGKLIATLRRRRLRFPSDLAVYVALQILRAVDYIHRAKSPGGTDMNLVHRDVTPSNIYVTFGGEVKLGDFGVARVSFLEPQEDGSLLKGKATYMPPEVLGGDPVDQSVDLWGAAAVLYEMLTARRIYEGVSDADLMRGIAPPPVLPLHKVNTDIDPKLSKILARALHVKASKRPRNAVEIYRQLKLNLQDSSIHVDGSALARFVWELTGSGEAPAADSATPDTGQFQLPEYKVRLDESPTQRFEAVRRRRRVPIIVGAGLVLVVLVLVGLRSLEIGAGSPTPERVTDVTGDDLSDAGEAPSDDATLDFSSASTGGDLEVEPPPGADIKDPAVRFKALMHRGKVQLKRGRHESALDAYDAALGLRPHSPAAQLGRAQALLALERYDLAEAAVNIALERRPRHLNAYLLLGNVLRARGDLEQARWAFNRCITIDPRGKAARAARQALEEMGERTP